MLEQHKYMKYNDTIGALIIGILLTLCLTSCMTNRKGELTKKGINFIANHCRGNDSTVTSHEIIFKDTTIFIDRIGEPIYLKSPCDSVAPIVKVKNGLKSTVLSIGKTKVFICEADSLRAVIKLLERKYSIVKKERVVIQKPCDKPHLKGWHYFLMWSGGIALILIFLKYAVKAIKTYFSGGL